MVSATELLRRILGSTIGVGALYIGAVVLIAGVASLGLGLFNFLVGEFHGGRAPFGALLYLSVGVLLSLGGYGCIRLGWNTLRASTRGAGFKTGK